MGARGGMGGGDIGSLGSVEDRERERARVKNEETGEENVGYRFKGDKNVIEKKGRGDAISDLLNYHVV